jgi:hypothetical protein
MHLWNLFILFLLEACYGFFFDHTQGLSFHFYLYGVREENALHFENFDKSFFVFCLLQFWSIIPNVCKSLLSAVVHSNVEPKLFFIIWCVVNHDKHTPLQKMCFFANNNAKKKKWCVWTLLWLNMSNLIKTKNQYVDLFILNYRNFCPMFIVIEILIIKVVSKPCYLIMIKYNVVSFSLFHNK